MIMSDPIKIRIESDGNPKNTKVFDIATGKPIDGISKITWECEPGEAATATLVFKMVQFSVIGDAWRKTIMLK